MKLKFFTFNNQEEIIVINKGNSDELRDLILSKYPNLSSFENNPYIYVAHDNGELYLDKLIQDKYWHSLWKRGYLSKFKCLYKAFDCFLHKRFGKFEEYIELRECKVVYAGKTQHIFQLRNYDWKRLAITIYPNNATIEKDHYTHIKLIAGAGYLNLIKLTDVACEKSDYYKGRINCISQGFIWAVNAFFGTHKVQSEYFNFKDFEKQLKTGCCSSIYDFKVRNPEPVLEPARLHDRKIFIFYNYANQTYPHYAVHDGHRKALIEHVHPNNSSLENNTLKFLTLPDDAGTLNLANCVKHACDNAFTYAARILMIDECIKKATANWHNDNIKADEFQPEIAMKETVNNKHE